MKKPVKKKSAPPVAIPLKSGKYDQPLLLLFGLSILLYFNTCFNEYALDDYLVISKNSYTQSGIDGIPDLLTKPSYFGFFKNTAEEVTLRYRPLVMISYAMECELFKNKSTLLFVSHLVNVLLFALTAAALYRLLSLIFGSGFPGIAFIASLLFVIHPVHTESVANIKGRDELLSMLFAIAAGYYLFRFLKDGKSVSYILSVICFTAGLFSKEGVISFLAVYPLMFFFFTPVSGKRSAKLMLPFVAVAVLYVIIRFSVTGWSHPPSAERLNNPFLGATPVEKYATILLSMGYYLKLLFFPHPLSYDYTFNQIMLVTFSEPLVWLSAAAHLFLLLVVIAGIKNKTVPAFSILFYFITILPVTNLFFNLGAFIGERLLYVPSLGFCLAIAFLLNKFSAKINTAHAAMRKSGIVLLAGLVILGGVKIFTRNAVWKNNFTLMIHDAGVSTNSMKANDACAVTLILATDDPALPDSVKNQYLYKAIYHDHKAAEIMPSFTDIYLNLGVAFSRLEMPDSAAYFWDMARRQKPGNSKYSDYDAILGTLFLKRGLKKAVNNDMAGCILDLEQAVKYAPGNAEAWYNYGGALFSTGKADQAKAAFMKVLELDPSHQQAQLGLQSLTTRK